MSGFTHFDEKGNAVMVDPGSYGCTDIGTHDNTHCLVQLHNTRIDKSDNHNGRR